MTSLEAEEAITAHDGVACRRPQTRQIGWRRPCTRAASAGAVDLHLPAYPEPSGRPEQSRRGVALPSPGGPRRNPYVHWRGSKVLDLTRVIAGPAATRLLGALGADVLRIDPPHLPELPDAFIDSGFDKRSAVANILRQHAGTGDGEGPR